MMGSYAKHYNSHDLVSHGTIGESQCAQATNFLAISHAESRAVPSKPTMSMGVSEVGAFATFGLRI